MRPVARLFRRLVSVIATLRLLRGSGSAGTPARASLRVSLAPVVAVVAIAALAAIPAAGRLLRPAPVQTGAEVAVFGPQLFHVVGSSQTYIESFAVQDEPGTRFRLVVVNGDVGGSDRVSAASVILNGAEVIESSEIDTSVSERSLEVELLDNNTIEVSVSGADSSYVEVTIWREPDPTFVIWGPQTVLPKTSVSDSLIVPGDAAPPYYLHLVNGASDGTGRVTSGRITINGVEVAGPSDLSQSVAGLVLEVALNPASSNLIFAEASGNPQSSYQIWIASSDSIPPAVSNIQPPDSTVTDQVDVSLTGDVQDRTAVTVLVNGDTAQMVSGGAAFSHIGALPQDGTNDFLITAVDVAGNATDSTRSIIRDTQAPLIALGAPVDGSITNASSVPVSGSAQDLTAVTVSANGVPLLVDGPSGYTGSVETSTFGGEVPLEQEGTNFVTVTVTDVPGSSSIEVRSVIRDTEGPLITVAAPADSLETEESSVEVSGSVADLTETVLKVNGITVAVAADSSFSHSVGLVEGENLVVVSATDAAGNVSTADRVVIRTAVVLPPDPASVAGPLDPTVPTTLDQAASFLFSGPDPIQTGVDSGAIDIIRFAVIRGRVIDRDGAALSGARVSVKGHPELGQTLTRLDGGYDLAVNGGGPLILDFQRSGYAAAQRTAAAEWHEYTVLDDLALVPIDTLATAVNLSGATDVQVARGSLMEDIDGPRRATVMFEPGTTATMLLPDGSEQPLTDLTVRATEFTVGENGRAAMPAPLPPPTGYTYAVALQVDEAEAAGAKQVRFSQPVPLYVENFLDFPEGVAVPVGIYDFDQAAWVPEKNGRIMAITAINNGLADLDTDGDGLADSDSVLAAQQITMGERERLAELYPVGQSLWRAPLEHFSFVDMNHGFRVAGTAIEAGKNWLFDDEPDSCETSGSIIECDNQVLGERVPLPGTPFDLAYRSGDMPGFSASRTVRVPILEDTVPTNLIRVYVNISVAGRRWSVSLDPAPNLEYSFTWDGHDAYGRFVHGLQVARIEIGYLYPAVYLMPAGNPAFGRSGSETTLVPRSAGVVTANGRWAGAVWRRTQATLGSYSVTGLGGWKLSAHHTYLSEAGLLVRGDGGRSSATRISPIVTEFVTTNARAVEAGPDGKVYFSAGNVRVVDREGNISTVVSGGSGYGGDGGPALNASVNHPAGLALGPDGSLYIADTGNHRVRRIGPDGIITTIAGTGVFESSGDGGPAKDAAIGLPKGIDIAADGSVYVSDNYNHTIRYISPDGLIHRVAGDGYRDAFSNTGRYTGDGVRAVTSSLNRPYGVRVAKDGSIFIADERNYRIRKVTPDGIIYTVAGRGSGKTASQSEWTWQEGAPADSTYVPLPMTVTVADDGSVFYTDNTYRLRQIATDGSVRTIAGRGVQPVTFGVPALEFWMASAYGLDISPSGEMYMTLPDLSRIVRMKAQLEGFGGPSFDIAETDGSAVYRFDAQGRHQATLDAMTGATLYSFGYDSIGDLAQVTDVDGLVTSIERDQDGRPLAITGPYGDRTSLAADANGWLTSIAGPAGDTVRLDHDAGGLLQTFTNPRGLASAFTYDPIGRLETDVQPGGGIIQLATSDLENGHEEVLTSPEGRTTTYRTTWPEWEGASSPQKVSDRFRSITDPAGLVTSSTSRAGTYQTTTRPDGTTITSYLGRSARWGMGAPITDSTIIATPGGRRMVVARRQAAVLADGSDPFTMVSEIDSMLVNGRVYTSLYEQTGRRFTSTTPAGRTSVSIVNEKGRVVKDSLAGVAATLYGYDAQGQPDSVSQGDRTWRFAYDAAGRLLSTRDPLGRSDSLFYDGAGRVTRQVLRNGREIGYGYDAAGNLTSLTPPGRPAHTFVYDALGLDSIYNPPDVDGLAEDRTFYSYNKDKDLTRILRPDSLAIDFAYDSAGRVHSITSPGGVLDYTYSPTSGQLTGITAPGGEALSFTYDGSLPIREASSGTVPGEVSFAYDNNFRLSGLAVNADTVAYGYNADGLLTSAGDLVLNRHPANGLLTSTSLGGVTTGRGYNEHGELMADSASANGTLIIARTYQRDDLGRITQIEDFAVGVTTLWGYGYDAAGRLETVTRNGAAYASYAYDANGNRLSRTSAAGVESGAYDAQDRLLSYDGATYTYTANGELQTKVEGVDTTRYAYDVWYNLTHVYLPDGTVIEYLIDGRNRRVGKRVNGLLVQGLLYGDQLNPVAQLDAAGNIVSRFVYGSKPNVPDYIIRGGEVFRVLPDHLGSVRMVVNVVTGEMAQRLSYDAWGRVLEDTNPGWQPFGFAGGVWERHSGLVRFGVRDYSPMVGRWTAADPARFGGLSSNLYAYATEDPANRRDANGLQTVIPVPGPFPIPLPIPAPSFPGKELGEALQKLWNSLDGAGWRIYDRMFREDGAGEYCPIPLPENPSDSPGEGWEWIGADEPGGRRGNWHNPSTGESLHPDLNHGPPHGPHWDYWDAQGNKWRVNPNTGQMEPARRR